MRLVFLLGPGACLLCMDRCARRRAFFPPAALRGASIIRAASFPTPPRMRRTGSILPTRGQHRDRSLHAARISSCILRDSSGAKLDSGATIRRPIEAGSYTLLVNARVPGQVGQYSVTTSFTAEPGTLCSAFPVGRSDADGVRHSGLVGVRAAGRHALRGVLAEHVRRGQLTSASRRPISRPRFSSARPMAPQSRPAMPRSPRLSMATRATTIVVATQRQNGSVPAHDLVPTRRTARRATR